MAIPYFGPRIKFEEYIVHFFYGRFILCFSTPNHLVGNYRATITFKCCSTLQTGSAVWKIAEQKFHTMILFTSQIMHLQFILPVQTGFMSNSEATCCSITHVLPFSWHGYKLSVHYSAFHCAEILTLAVKTDTTLTSL